MICFEWFVVNLKWILLLFVNSKFYSRQVCVRHTKPADEKQTKQNTNTVPFNTGHHQTNAIPKNSSINPIKKWCWDIHKRKGHTYVL